MFSTIVTFLGGSAFRMLWGEISSWLSERQAHKHEVERIKLQAEIDGAQHARNQDAIRLQAELGVQTIRVQGEADLSKIDAESFGKGVENLNKTTGIAWVDAWKSVIQPLIATVMLVLVGLHYHGVGWKLDDRGWELAGAVFGLFLADRMLFRRGK